MPLSALPEEVSEGDDATVFPAARPAFLHAWLRAEGHVGRTVTRDGRLAAWGVARPCRRGRKIGPLIADDCSAADAVLAALVRGGEGKVFLDVPDPTGKQWRSLSRMG